MIEKKYETKRNLESVDGINQWFKRCQAEKKPYVVINTKTKYADVSWDHINLPKAYDSVFSDNWDSLRAVFEESFSRYWQKGKSSYTISAGYAKFESIPIDSAPLLAEEVYDTIMDFMSKD